MRSNPPDDAALEALATARDRGGIFVDFDGTLAPIVEDPERAVALPGAADALEDLAARFAVVAVVSGRPVAALRALLGTPRGVRLLGLYGIESLVGGVLEVDREVARQRDAVHRAAELLDDALTDADGVSVERKGLSVAVHYRRAPDHDAARAVVDTAVRDIAGRTGLGQIRPGRLVLEIGPATRVDKGSAVASMIDDEDLEAVLVAGDDEGDVPAFEAAVRAPTAVRIAVVSDEMPPRVAEVTDAAVASPDELLDVLRRLARLAAD